MPESLTSAGPTNDLRRYLDLTVALFVEIDLGERITLINEHAAQLLGYEPAELFGYNFFETCLVPEARELAREAHQRVMTAQAAGESYELPIITRDGRTRLIAWRSSPVRNEAGQVTRCLCAGDDVTERRDAEQSLDRVMKALRSYKFALDASAIVAMTDPKGRISYVNEKFCEISKYRREELMGQDHRILNSGYHPKSFFRQLFSTIKSGRVWRGDIRNRAKDGSLYWVSTTIVPFLDDRGEPESYIAIRYEITERKLAEAALERTVRDLAVAREAEAQRAEALKEAHDRLEEANRQIREEQQKMIQAEKLSSIGLLAAGVAHEINNPLAGVMACVKALSEGSVKATRKDEYFATAKEGLERIQQIVRNLLDFSRQRPPEPSHLDPKDLVDACERLIAPTLRKQDVSLVFRLPEPAPRLVADRSQMMQAVINVLMNATYVSPKGQVIDVSLREQPGQLGLCLRDYGPGMSEETILRACDPFYTTKPEGEGTGLGLAVTQSIMRAHGGELMLESPPVDEDGNPSGLGTAVTLWLPKDEP